MNFVSSPFPTAENNFPPFPFSTSTSLFSTNNFAWNYATKNNSIIDQNIEIARDKQDEKPMAFKGNKRTKKSSDIVSKWALSHPLCTTNVTAYVGQTAKMHCCLARLERDLSVNYFYLNLSHVNFIPAICLHCAWQIYRMLTEVNFELF